MRTTRRELLIGVATITLALAVGRFDLLHAQSPAISAAELLQPGPLGEMVMGAENAPVTVIEYASMTCPHCASFHEKTLPEIKKRYIDSGKVRLLFREFPFDPVAAGAFMLARCAGKDKYFSMIDVLFAEQTKWAVRNPIEPLLAIAKQAGFTQASFEQCLSDQKVLDGIEWVRNRGAEKFGVNSTPTFFVNGNLHKGALTVDEMSKVIDGYLKG